MENYKNNANDAVILAAYRAWSAAHGLRADRLRNKRFTYGDQWIDTTVDAHGRTLTEWERYTSDAGGAPITNNVLRQLVKTIVGRFRSQHLKDAPVESHLAQVHSENCLDELDSRTLEEFLISGCCVQRVDVQENLCHKQVNVSQVNVNRFFMNAPLDPLCRDCEIVGQVHDLSMAQLLQRVAHGSRKKAAWVRRVYTENMADRTAAFTAALGADSATGQDFWYGRSGKCRAIEVWTLESQEVLVCHDRATAQLQVLPLAEARRIKPGDDVSVRWDIAMRWQCRWFAPSGELLDTYVSPFAHGSHPFIIKLYPLTDGEVHSFIEDVIDQQKYLNRLITLVNHIMDASAKGVLLFPDTAIPNGFTWDDVRAVWRNCNGVLPYTPGMDAAKPEQISTNATNIGAYDMIQLQMRLLEEISGVSGALQGRNVNTSGSATLYQSQVDNSNIALADIFETFNAFRSMRDAKIRGL